MFSIYIERRLLEDNLGILCHEVDVDMNRNNPNIDPDPKHCTFYEEGWLVKWYLEVPGIYTEYIVFPDYPPGRTSSYEGGSVTPLEMQTFCIHLLSALGAISYQWWIVAYQLWNVPQGGTF